jgi:hypothetical protein
MPKIAYRFVPCDENGRPVEGSQLTSIRDGSERIEVGSVIEASLLGYAEWEVVEIRESSGPIGAACDSNGVPIAVVGTLVCRGII